MGIFPLRLAFTLRQRCHLLSLLCCTFIHLWVFFFFFFFKLDACVCFSFGEGSLRRRSQQKLLTTGFPFEIQWILVDFCDLLVPGKLLKSFRVKFKKKNKQKNTRVSRKQIFSSQRSVQVNKCWKEATGCFFGVRCVVFFFFFLQWGRGGGASFINQASQLKKAAVHQSEDNEE